MNRKVGGIIIAVVCSIPLLGVGVARGFDSATGCDVHKRRVAAGGLNYREMCDLELRGLLPAATDQYPDVGLCQGHTTEWPACYQNVFVEGPWDPDRGYRYPLVAPGTRATQRLGPAPG